MKKVKYARIHNYDRTGNLKQDGTAQIYIRAYLQAKNKFFPTGICVAPKQWDKRNRRIVNHPYQVRFNQVLSELETKLEAFELKVFQREGNISLDRLGDYKNENIDISFTDFYLQELENPQLTHQSFTDQRQTLQKLQAFRSRFFE